MTLQIHRRPNSPEQSYKNKLYYDYQKNNKKQPLHPKRNVDEARNHARAADQAAQRAALQRSADRRPQHLRRRAGAGGLRGGEENGSHRRLIGGHAGGRIDF